MDQNKSVQLDPKLREAYERVMGTSFPSPSGTQAQPQPTPISPTPVAQTVGVGAAPTMPAKATVTHPAANPNVFVAKGGSKGIPAILLVLIAIIFFVAYTVVWMVIFKIPIPFLPA